MTCQYILCLFLLMVNGNVWAKNLGEPCNNQETDECSIDNSECRDVTCACKDGFTEDGGNCLKDLGVACGNADECVSNAVCDSTCKCKTGYEPESGLCQKVLGSVCTTDNSATVCIVTNSECRDGFCKCKTGHTEENAVCKKNLGQNCASVDECLTNAVCATTCGCKAGYDPESGLCKKVLGSTCTTENSGTVCSVTDSECENTLCKCKAGHTEENDVCEKVLDSVCTTDNSATVCIVTNSECRDGFCKCKAGHAEENTICKKVLDSVCTTDNSATVCIVTNSECRDGFCKCKAGHAEENTICKKAPVSEVVCTAGGDECKDIAHSACDTSTGVLKCKCEAGYKVDATDDSICAKVSAAVSDVVCSAEGDECTNIAHSECDTTPLVLRCTCLEGYKENLTDTSTCVKVIGIQCSDSDACLGATNSKCENGKCACAADYEEKNDACKLTVSGTVCTDTGVECDKIDNAICDAEGGKCKCSPSFTMNIDTCVSENGAATSRHMEASVLAISVLFAIKVAFG